MRTDNTLQAKTRAVEYAPFNTTNPAVGAGGPVPGSTQIGGNLFRAGDGVNVGSQAAGTRATFDNGSSATGFSADAPGAGGRTTSVGSNPSDSSGNAVDGSQSVETPGHDAAEQGEPGSKHEGKQEAKQEKKRGTKARKSP